MNSKQYIELKALNNLPLDQENGLMIEPSKDFVLKTKLINQEKLFINVLSHPVIESPSEQEILQDN